MENFSEAEICTHLRANPDLMYITPSGDKLYVLIPDKGVLCLTTEEDLSKMDSEQLNKFLQDCMQELTK